ncbi:hypothetical protein EMIHUDRAFT_62011 [Emiliania huxleyi CCMP1516]|uniref:PPM-type phosphatase domain-containing protein n=2 Tax=Emiliania huxleyi TaxID=2903 RepID=A0A0D3IE67_EMIH1|nr:hypothetical protein EMIHUDRAFT_62011 [Emiliania huxleyi CCMP1516]EOD09552.1 hypothetical protein EMIHUDRAFT_62011 [Emiliania huxleyi CCMP1516]|eukprot:XP_005761981.1 hypothetical protein EMIHUDRAFT_62011 [Emiliania huxleyi CCMP1516]
MKLAKPRDEIRAQSVEKAAVLLRSGAASAQGPRRTMEDRHIAVDDGWLTSWRGKLCRLSGSETWPHSGFYGVFDGHAGVRAANIARGFLWNKIQPVLVERLRAGGSEELPPGELVAVVRRAFHATEEEVLSRAVAGRWVDGCTAITCLIHGHQLIVGNLGDSRAVLCRGTEADHKPGTPSEQARIVAAGGSVQYVFGVARLNGGLSLSRAFGDLPYKHLPKRGESGPLSSVPDVTVHELSPRDRFLVLACDGVFDLWTDQDVVRLVGEGLRRSGDSPTAAASHLARASLQHRFCSDNVTVVVVMLDWHASRA